MFLNNLTMNKTRYILLLFFISSLSIGQNQRIDSLLAIVAQQKMDTIYFSSLARLGIEYERVDSKQAIYYFRKNIEESGKDHHKWSALAALRVAGIYSSMGINDSTDYYFEISSRFLETHPEEIVVKRNYLTGMGIHQNRIGNYWEALKHYDEISKMDADIIGKQNIAGNYLNISNVYQALGMANESIEATFKSLTLFEELQNKMGLSFCYNSLGNLYYNQKEYEKAEEWYLKSSELRKETDDNRGQAIALNNLGNLMMDTNRYDEALDFFNKAKTINEAFGIKDQVCANLINIGMTYEKMGEPNLALNALTEAQILSVEMANFSLETIVLLHLGNIYSQKGENQKAESTLKEALNRYSSVNDQKGNQRAYNALYNHYENTGQFREAFQYKTLFHQVKDSIENVELKLKINNLESRHEFVKKEQENELLTIENDLINQQKNNQFRIFILGLIFVTSIGILLFYQNRQRKKANTKLTLLNQELDQANKVKTRFFSILNHDLRSPMANLISFLHLKKESPELLDDETKNRMDAKTVHTAENLLQSMEDMLLWSKGQMEHFAPQFKKVAISSLFNDNQKVFSGYQHIEIQYINKENLEIITDEDYLKTILRNLTSNAINVITSAKNPKIVWKAWRENAVPFISITDNGPGASREKLKALFDENHVVGIKTGLGLHLIRDLAKPIYCKIEIESLPGEGTTFILEFQESNNKSKLS